MVIRIPDVTLSRSDLETALGRPVDRHEPRSGRASMFAQIDIDDDRDQWVVALGCIQSLQAPVQRLVAEGLIGSPCVDVAVGLPASAVATSLTIPARLAVAAGAAGMDVVVSVYSTSSA